MSEAPLPSGTGMRNVRLLLATLVVLALVAGGAGWLQRARPDGGAAAAAQPPLTAHLPSDAEGTLWVPDLGVLGARLRALESLKVASFAAQLQGHASGQAWVGAFLGQVGLDLRVPEDLAAAGLDPGRGAGAAWTRAGPYVVVAVRDAQAWRAFVQRLATSRLGATAAVEDGDVTAWTRRDGTAVLAMARLPGAALLAASPAAQVKAWAGLPRGRSLAEDAEFAAARERLGGTAEAWGRLPAGSGWAGEAGWLGFAGATAALRLSAGALTLDVDVRSTLGREESRFLEKVPVASLPAGVLPQDAVALVRYAGDPAALEAPWRDVLGGKGREAFTAAGLDPVAGVLRNLEPGAVASVSVSPSVQLAASPALDVRQTNPFRYLHVVAAAAVKDPAAAAGVLEALPRVAPGLGARMERATRAGSPALLTQYAQGEGLHFALSGKTLLAASPVARLDAALGQLSGAAGPGPGLAPAAVAAAEGWPIAVVVDLHRLADTVRALPGDAWGPGGSFVKAGWVRWLDGTDDLAWVLAGLSARPGSLQGRLTLGLARP
jgi:hypothetical protein